MWVCVEVCVWYANGFVWGVFRVLWRVCGGIYVGCVGDVGFCVGV